MGYLENLAAGKTSTGGKASAGNIAWAKAQLAKNPTPAVTNTTTANTAQKGILGTGAAAAQAFANKTPTTSQNVQPNANTAPQTPEKGSQASHQAWINNAKSGYGSMDKYKAEQQGKYNAALASGDTAMLDRLKADMARVGYTLNAPTAQAVTPTMTTPTQSQQATPGEDYISNLRNLAAQNASAQAYDSRNQADAINLQNAKNLQEIMANRGLGASGENITATLAQNAQRGNSLNSINNQLAENLRNIDISQNEQMLQNLYRNQDVDFRNQQFDWQKAMDVAGLTGQYDGQRTLAGRSADLANKTANWGAYMDMVNQTGNLGQGPAQDWSYLFKRAQEAQGGSPLTLAGQQFKYGQEQDRIANEMAERQFALDQQREARIGSGGGGSGGSRSGGSGGQSVNTNTIIDNINTLYTAYDRGTGQRKVTDPLAIESYILNLGLPDDITGQLLGYYGISGDYQEPPQRSGGTLR